MTEKSLTIGVKIRKEDATVIVPVEFTAGGKTTVKEIRIPLAKVLERRKRPAPTIPLGREP